VFKTIEKKLKRDPKNFILQAEKEMGKQNAITAAEAQAEQADKEQKEAKDNLQKWSQANEDTYLRFMLMGGSCIETGSRFLR